MSISELFNRYCMVAEDRPKIEISRVSGQFVCVITIGEVAFEGSGRSQKLAKESCLRNIQESKPEIFQVGLKSEKKDLLPTIEEACLNKEVKIETVGNKLIFKSEGRTVHCYSRDNIWETLLKLADD